MPPGFEDELLEARPPRLGDVPKNPKVKCKGRTVIRYEHDDDEHRKGDPILDYDGARQYRPCLAWAANGTEHCVAHGGNAPSAINAARRGMALATPNAFEVLRLIAEDERAPWDSRIKAASGILDRAGVRAGIEIGLEAPKWQGVLAKMFGSPVDEDEPEEPEPSLTPTESVKPEPELPARPAKKLPAKRASAKASGRPKFEGW